LIELIRIPLWPPRALFQIVASTGKKLCLELFEQIPGQPDSNGRNAQYFNSSLTKNGSITVEPLIALFDIDGTLTPARRSASPQTLAFLKALRTHIPLAVVGGSDFPKQQEQLGEDVLDSFDYSFSENGLVAYKGREQIGRTSIRDYLIPEQRLRFANWMLDYIARMDIPVKTGTFIEMRTGMYNISPIGRNCTYEERLAFLELDKRLNICHKMCEDCRAAFAGWGLKFSIGGQISIDIFPESWTKVYCL
jgi:phosphomannomutase